MSMSNTEKAIKDIRRNTRRGTDKLTYFSSKSGVLEIIAPNKKT